jgi:hypothetical protein
MDLNCNDYLRSQFKNGMTRRTLKLYLTDLHCSNERWSEFKGGDNTQVRQTHLNCTDEFKSEFNKGDKTWSTFQVEETQLLVYNYNELGSRIKEGSKTWPSLHLEPIDLRCNDELGPECNKGADTWSTFNSKKLTDAIVMNLVLASKKAVRPDLVCSSTQTTYAAMAKLSLNSRMAVLFYNSSRSTSTAVCAILVNNLTQ